MDRNLTGKANYRRVLNQLRLVRVNQKMGKNTEGTVFKDIVSPNVSLLKQSNLLNQYGDDGLVERE